MIMRDENIYLGYQKSAFLRHKREKTTVEQKNYVWMTNFTILPSTKVMKRPISWQDLVHEKKGESPPPNKILKNERFREYVRDI